LIYVEEDLGARLGGAAGAEGLVVAVDPEPPHAVAELVPLLRRQVVRLVELEPVLRDLDGGEAGGRVGAVAAQRPERDEKTEKPWHEALGHD
jgi:hypothetical protein